MNDYQEARAVREEAQAVMNYVTGETVKHRLNGSEPPPHLTAAGEAARNVMWRAGEVEAKALTAAMETLDPVEFAKARQARLAEGGHGIGCRCAGLDQRCSVVVRREQIEKRRQALIKRSS